MSESIVESNHRGVIGKDELYRMASAHSKKAIEKLALLLDHGNPSVRLGAIKLILNKTIPDLKSLEVGGHDGQPLQVQIMTYGSNDPLLTYITKPATREVYSTDIQRSPPLSSPELASQSPQDNNSNQSVNTMGSDS